MLYIGEDLDAGDGGAYRNAERFLNTLPEFSLRADMVQAKDIEQTDGQGFHLTM